MSCVSWNLMGHVSHSNIRRLWSRECFLDGFGDAILKPNSATLRLLDNLTLDRPLLNDLSLNKLLSRTLLNLLRRLLRCLRLLDYIPRRSNIKRLLSLRNLLLSRRLVSWRGVLISWRLILLPRGRCSCSRKRLTLC